MNSQIEEMHRAEHVGRGVEHSYPSEPAALLALLCVHQLTNSQNPILWGVYGGFIR